MLAALEKLNRRLKPCAFLNFLRRSLSNASNSSPSNLEASALLSSLILELRGSNQNKLVVPLIEAATKAVTGILASWKGAENNRIRGVTDCIRKNLGNTLLCTLENCSLSKALNIIGEAA